MITIAGRSPLTLLRGFLARDLLFEVHRCSFDYSGVRWHHCCPHGHASAPAFAADQAVIALFPRPSLTSRAGYRSVSRTSLAVCWPTSATSDCTDQICPYCGHAAGGIIGKARPALPATAGEVLFLGRQRTPPFLSLLLLRRP